MPDVAKPEETLSIVDAGAIIVGTVVGVGIFRTPSVVAAHAESAEMVLLFWLLGGLASLAGALCYAELMCAYPHVGGEYHYLFRAFGPVPAFLYAWARLVVIQTGAIAMVAFIIGDYASEIFRLGPYSASIYAASGILAFTAVNMAGIRQGKWMQKVLVLLIAAGLLLISAAGIVRGSAPVVEGARRLIPGHEALGAAMIFVLLTYGGWNEASFLSAEVRSGRRNLLRVLLCSIGLVTAVYLLVNIAVMKSLGLPAAAASGAVMADVGRKIFGEAGGRLISLLILAAAASTVNAAIITGARTGYALGHDSPILGFLGKWNGRRRTPVNALLLQGGIALVLVALGTGVPDGFVMMVEYTAPVFWLFFLMVGISIFILRHRYADVPRPFRIPLYPLTPIVFCAICVFMLHASLVYTGKGAWLGIGVLVSGIPLLLLRKRRGTGRGRHVRATGS